MAWWKKTKEEKESHYRNQRLQETRSKDIALLRGERQGAEIKLAKASLRRKKLTSKAYGSLSPTKKQLSGLFAPPMDIGLGFPSTSTKKRKNKLFDF